MYDESKLILKSIIVFWELIVAGTMVLNCSSVYVTEYHSLIFSKIITFLFCTGMFFLCLIAYYKRKKFGIVIIKYNAAIVVWMLVYFAFSHYNISSTICFIVELILLTNYVLLSEKNGIISILKTYKTLMIFISLSSLFFWLFGSVFNIIEPTGQIYSTWTGDENQLAVFKGYFGIHFETQSIDMFDDAGMLRNTSIFNEGPMYSLHLSLALLIELFIEKRPAAINVVLFLITILTTMSSTGYVLSLGALFLKFYIWSKGKYSFKYFSSIALCILLTSISYIVWQLFNYRADTVSGLIRFDDYLVAINTWISSPIFGVGILNYDAMRQNMDAWRFFNTGYSNSIGLVLAQGGIWLFLPLIYFFYISIKKSYKEKKYNALSLSILFLFLMFFATGIYKFNMLCFLAYLLFNMKNSKLDAC